MIGDQTDMLARLKATLPSRWFADNTPVMDGMMSGMAATAAWAHSLLKFVQQQARLATANNIFLDLAAIDFFGQRVARAMGQSDAAFRAKRLRELYRVRATRPAIATALEDWTGRPPDIFEPTRPADTGAWNGQFAYGMAGRWGSLSLPNQIFVTGFRPMAGDAAHTNVSDTDIYADIAGLLPVATTAWTRISD